VVPVRLRLRHLVVVVRELEVDAAPVNVQRGAQQLRRHHAAAGMGVGVNRNFVRHYETDLHSMCQPGLPLPHGLSHSGSPALLAFHTELEITHGCVSCILRLADLPQRKVALVAFFASLGQSTLAVLKQCLLRVQLRRWRWDG
jgi:hypothetical protein